MNLPEHVDIVEVGPRDGLQNESAVVSTQEKLEFIRRLSQSGLKVIEAASFVSAKWVPQMADAAEIVAHLPQQPALRFPVLVFNRKGYEDCVAAGAQDIALVSSASQTFSRKNSNCSMEHGLKRCLQILQQTTKEGIGTRAYITCSLDCPYEGKTEVTKTLDTAQRLYQGGCSQIVIADTTGRATPEQVEKLLTIILTVLPAESLAVHFHDTNGLGMAKILTALQLGIAVVDSSAAGLGGCPFAKGTGGNVATENLVYMLEGLGVDTGIDLQVVQSAGKYICEKLGRSSHAKLQAVDISADTLLSNISRKSL